MKRSLLGVGIVMLIACGTSASHEDAPLGRVHQELIADHAKYTGADLADHELAFTFDDGPGPLDVSGALAEWLNKHKNKDDAAQPIQSTFFVNGACIAKTPLSNGPHSSCDAPVANADAVLAKLVVEGHYVANHSTTHRSFEGEVGNGEFVAELKETDDLILKHQVWNRAFFRAPYGGYGDDAYNALKDSAMNKYAGPIYWAAGGGPTNNDRAADWDCWNKGYTTKRCGDLYLKEIRALGKGIVLFHDPYGDTGNHNLTSGTGNTVDMVKYIVGELDNDATPWKYKRLDEVPAIAAVLPKCDASCLTCSGPEADKCLTCETGKRVDAGRCVADNGSSGSSGGNGDDDDDSTSGSSGGTSGASGSNGSSGNDAAPAADEGGCNASGAPGQSSNGLVLGLGLGLAICLRSKRRRT